jgi:hypothetical protein
MRYEPSLKWGALLLALPLVVAACANEPKTEETAAMSPAEQSCAAEAAKASGVDAATIAVTKTTVTTEGGSIYTAKTDALSYLCVTDADQKVTSFTQEK